MTALIAISYIVSAVLFIFGLKMLGRARTAVRGNLLSALGMLLAVIVTLLDTQVISYQWILLGLIIGAAVGAVSALRIKMTSMPEMVALFNGTGGAASLLVGWAEYHRGFGSFFQGDDTAAYVPLGACYLAVLIGGVTFTGSLIAYAKLAERIDSKTRLFPAQQLINAFMVLLVAAGGVVFLMDPNSQNAYAALMCTVGISLLLGVLVTLPIGGADMPVVIALLNSYSGLAACAAGFVIENTVLIVSGSLVGASGLVLTNIMCKAMNRSLANVLFSGFGAGAGEASGSGGEAGEVRPITADDAYYILEAASSVVFVPGYGMAVAQAQHVVHELGQILEANGVDVKYAVHPVAGRMPGHMNVLLAEASVPYEQLVEMDDINPVLPSVDVCIVIGANDVVNPAAREDESSPIYGMPIINVDHAHTVFVLKRSMASGFAGIENPLFFKENTRMLFGDAKKSVGALVEQFKSS